MSRILLLQGNQAVVEGAIAARTTSNGTAPKSVVLQIAKLRSNAALTKKWVETASQKFIRTMTL